MQAILLENFQSIIEKFYNYYGDFRYFTLFIFALFVNIALIKKEDKQAKNLVVYLPIFILLILFNPWVYMFVKPFADKGGVYWRFFWLVPLAPTLAYAITKVISLKDNKFQKIVLFLLAVIIIVFSGKYMYSEFNFQKVNNVYKCPDDILNAIIIMSSQEKENKKAMVPIEIVPWVRQYDASISIEYNRSPSNLYNRFVRDFEECKIKAYMQQYLNDGCNFFVLNRWGEYDANLEDYGFEKVGENVNFLVYMLK